jgi:hypothetical protein
MGLLPARTICDSFVAFMVSTSSRGCSG